jgi:pyrimidine operon attenuation protein/uracil phosphoribosyltransferase
MSSTRILEADQIERKLQRIARQILEDFHTVADLHFITIAGNGEPVGIRLAQIIQEIGPTRVHASTVTLNKQAPLSQEIQLSTPLKDLKDQQVVIVDDVLNSGKTLMYAVHHILSAGPSRVATAVLVDRIHRSFPIRADYCGLSLSTNLKEHIDVRIAAAPHTDDEAILFD